MRGNRLTGGSKGLEKSWKRYRLSADGTSIPPGPKVKPHPQVCLEHCLKKVTACLEICKAPQSSKD